MNGGRERREQLRERESAIESEQYRNRPLSPGAVQVNSDEKHGEGNPQPGPKNVLSIAVMKHDHFLYLLFCQALLCASNLSLLLGVSHNAGLFQQIFLLNFLCLLSIGLSRTGELANKLFFVHALDST